MNIKTNWCISGNALQQYIKDCKNIVANDIIFNNFRSKKNNSMNLIIENSNCDYTKEHLPKLIYQYPELLSYFDKFLTSDKIGSPELCNINDIIISNTSNGIFIIYYYLR